MLLTKSQKKLIAEIDERINKRILQNTSMLSSDLQAIAPQVKNMLDMAESKEMDMYVLSYPGFHQYIKLLTCASMQ